MKRGAKIKPGFRESVQAAEDLQLKAGLSALKKAEGKSQIRKGKSAKLEGSVDIDGDCLKRYPNSNRWDYVVGVARTMGDTAVFIEVHPAETSKVSDIERKLKWLFDVYLAREAQEPLRALPREVHWVASSRVHIPATTPQSRYLATTLRKKYRLQGPAKLLEVV